MAWAEINGSVLRYDTRGNGAATIVLIHEMGGTLETWDFVIDELARAARVIRFDMRGCGLSEWAPEPQNIDTLAADVKGLLMHLGVTSKVVVAGCAVGGAVAIHFAAAYPDDVAALVASSPAVGIAPERRPAALARADQFEAEGVVTTLDARLLNGYPLEMRTDAKRFEAVRARRRAASPLGMSSLIRLLATLDLSDDYARIRCPSLLLAGIYDGDRPPAGVKAIAEQIPGAEYRVVESGHYMPMQNPEQFLGEMTSFLKAHALLKD